ncbi:MAG: peptide chain release factor N(5)-glutamine methyltransferase [Holosporales bacterium]|nr:peptide chain release factor N(5)-glutamine methyltransferase [Holosporales bacterium]
MITVYRRDLFNLSKIIDRKELLLLLAYITGQSYHQVFFAEQNELSNEQFSQLLNCIKRAFAGEPVSKITRSKEFYGISYITGEYTMDPRPETELIIDLFLKCFLDNSACINILDLGCGTGCIALTILTMYKNSRATLADIDENTLEIAKENATKLKVYDRCDFVKTNWFSDIKKQYEVIVTNPPYVSSESVLDKSTLYDPHRALFAGVDGLEAYKQIMPKAHDYLKKNGMLFVEIGINQKDHVSNMADKLQMHMSAKDLSGIERTLVFTKL